MIDIFISGASSGLGRSLYKALKFKKVFITVLGRNSPKNLRKKDTFVNIDFSKRIQFKHKKKENIEKVIFISNAGIIDPISSITQINQKLLRINYEVNFFSPFIIASELTRVTKDQEIPLHILNISSGAANKAVKDWSAYCSSKAAFKIALDCLKLENKHLIVDHINPGVLDTNMQHIIRSNESLSAHNDLYFTNLYKRGLLRKPEIVAKEIVNVLFSKHIK